MGEYFLKISILSPNQKQDMKCISLLCSLVMNLGIFKHLAFAFSIPGIKENLGIFKIE